MNADEKESAQNYQNLQNVRELRPNISKRSRLNREYFYILKLNWNKNQIFRNLLTVANYFSFSLIVTKMEFFIPEPWQSCIVRFFCDRFAVTSQNMQLSLMFGKALINYFQLWINIIMNSFMHWSFFLKMYWMNPVKFWRVITCFFEVVRWSRNL